MTQVTALLQANFKNPSGLSKATGRPYTTVKGWWDLGRIPYCEWPSVADAGGVSTEAIFKAHEADRLAAEAA